MDFRCTAFDAPSQGLESASPHLGSTGFEIDISPELSVTADLDSKTTELQSSITELKDENELLKDEIAKLRKQVAQLNAPGSTPLPILYHQLSAARNDVEALEKRCHELETENTELSHRLERREHLQSGFSLEPPSDLPSRSPLARSLTLYSEDHEATKLDFAEKLVEREDTIRKLRQEREACSERLKILDAGIDGVETRFALTLSTYQTEISQKFNTMLEKVHELHSTETEIDRELTAMQTRMRQILASFPTEIEQLMAQQKTLDFQRRQEKREMDEMLEHKCKNLEEAKKQISVLSDEKRDQTEALRERDNRIEELEFKIASMKTQRLVPGDFHESVHIAEELETLRGRVVHLERSLAEQELVNETLLRQREEAEEAFRVTDVKEDFTTAEDLRKENRELKAELMEVSEKLVAAEEHSEILKEETENQSDFFGRCLNLEEELEAQRRVNRGLEERLGRRKKRIDTLQSELGKLRQQLGDIESSSAHRKRAKQNKAAMSSHVDDMIQHERRYEELDRILNGVQAERDGLLQDKAALNKMLHSMVKENKAASRALNKLKRESTELKEKLEGAKLDMTKLQARLKVEALARQHSNKSNMSAELDDDVMSKLVASQIALAEMDQRMLKLRKELHRSVARNMYLAAKVARLEKLPKF